MKEKLKELLKNSQSPYYNYQVASILVTKDNKEHKGVNVETSSPGAGICAERVALYSAIANGYKKGDFREIHIMSKGQSFPCFICRQTLNDYCDLDTKIISYNIEGEIKETTVEELCVYPFNDGDMKWEVGLLV